MPCLTCRYECPLWRTEGKTPGGVKFLISLSIHTLLSDHPGARRPLNLGNTDIWKDLLQTHAQKNRNVFSELHEITKCWELAWTNFMRIGSLPKSLAPTIPGHAGRATGINFVVIFQHFYFHSQLESGSINVCKMEIGC